MFKAFKAVIVGCGKIAGYYDKSKRGPVYSHAHAYFKSPDIGVIDYVDIRPEKAGKLAAKYRSKNFSTDFAGSVERNRPDVVSICTPDDEHFGVVEKILKGKFVPRVIFIEKPACSNIGELIQLKRLAAKRGAFIIINHSRRFEPKYKEIRKSIRAGRFGNLVRADIFYYGGLRHNAVHVLDTLLFLFNDALEVKEVGRKTLTRHRDDPTYDVRLKFKNNGADVYLHGFDEKYYQIFDLDLKFEKARLRIENFEERYLLQEKKVNDKDENVLVERRFDLKCPSGTPMENAVSSIARYLKTGQKNCIADAGIGEAEETMRTLWECEKKS